MAGEPSGEWVAADDVQLDAHEEQAGQRGPVAGKIAVIPDEPMFTASSFAQGAGARPSKPPARARRRAVRAAPARACRAAPDLRGPRLRADPRRARRRQRQVDRARIDPCDGGRRRRDLLRRPAQQGQRVRLGRGQRVGIRIGERVRIRIGSGSVAAAAIDAGAVTPPATPDAQSAEPTADTIAVARDALLADVTGHLTISRRACRPTSRSPARSRSRRASSRPRRRRSMTSRCSRATRSSPRSCTSRPSRRRSTRCGSRSARCARSPATPRPASRWPTCCACKASRRARSSATCRPGSPRRIATRAWSRRCSSCGRQARAARADLERLDSGDDAMEKTGDVRARFRRAMVAFAAGDGATARQLANDVIALQPDHQGAKALLARVTDKVASSDPLPPEDYPRRGRAARRIGQRHRLCGQRRGHRGRHGHAAERRRWRRGLRGRAPKAASSPRPTARTRWSSTTRRSMQSRPASRR